MARIVRHLRRRYPQIVFLRIPTKGQWTRMLDGEMSSSAPTEFQTDCKLWLDLNCSGQYGLMELTLGLDPNGDRVDSGPSHCVWFEHSRDAVLFKLFWF